DHRRRVVSAGNGYTNWVGGEPTLAAAERGHPWGAGVAVDEVDGDQPSRRGDLAVGADPPDVVRIAQPVHGDTPAPGGLDGPAHRISCDHLAIAVAPVPYREIAALAH